MGLKTPLYAVHERSGAKIVDFGGWDMPLHYGSQLDEHRGVRDDAGLFDVSHMGQVDVHGARAREFLRFLLANDVGRLRGPGQGLYSCMLRDDGGVLDDLIVYRLTESSYRLIVNAATRDKDLAWIGARAAPYGIEVILRQDLAMVAVQGPHARAKSARILGERDGGAALALARMHAATFGDRFIARAGYTGEDGFEIAVPAHMAADLWDALCAEGVRPAGLAARDTLRLEAGLCLYGNDLDEQHHPLESGVAWTVAFDPADRDFVGRQALLAVRGNETRELVGLLLDERGVLRRGQTFATPGGPGEITSGTFSPTLGRAIALARAPAGARGQVEVQVRGAARQARIVAPPFVRNGRVLVPT